MAINPIVIFASLSVATVGGIVVVQQVNKPAPSDRPAIVQKQVTPLLEPVTKTAPEAPVKKLALIAPAKKTPSFPPAVLDDKALEKLSPLAPSFDIVRVEQDGGAVVVGKAAPNASISLKLNGKEIGKTKSNQQGDWVFIPDQLIPSGSHEMVVEAQGIDKKPVRSKQSIFIAIAKDTKQKPLVVVSTPNTPTKVLQVPDAKPTPVATASKKVKTVTKLAAKSNLAVPAKMADKKPAEAIVKQAIVEQTKAKPVSASPKAVSSPTKVAPTKVAPTKVAEAPVLEKPAKPIVKPQLTPLKSSKKLLKRSKIADSKPKLKPAKLVFGTVDYNDQGNIVFSGKAAPRKTVRLYIDNKVVGDAVSDEKGNWVFKGKRSIQAGLHELRADQLSTTGKVTQRTAVPFVRAAARKVAALIKKRVKASQEKVEPVVSTAKIQPKAHVEPKANVSEESAPTAKTPQAPAIVQAVQPDVKVVAKTQVNQPVSTEKTPEPKQDLVSHVIIQPGNNLWNISRVIYGKGVAYTTIFQANKTQIKNPHRIYPGQILETPGAMSTGSIGPDERESGNGENG